MAAHKRERKQAAVKVEFGFRVPRETDSRWDAVPIGRWNGFTLGLGYGFTLGGWDVVTVGRGYVKRVLRC